MKKTPINAIEIDKNPLLLNEFDKQQYLALIELVEKYNRLSTRVIDIEKYPDYAKHSKAISAYRSKNLLSWINSKTHLLSDNEFEYALSTKIYWIFRGMVSFPICPQCGRTFGIHKNVTSKGGYHKFCSIQCVNKSEDTRNKIKQTNELRYGDANYNNREQSKKTTNEHYGVDNIFKAKEFIDKQRILLHENKDTRMKHFKENCLKKHGVSHPMKLKEVKDKVVANRIYKPLLCPYKSRRYEIDGVNLDSSYELIYFVWLRDNGYRFEYHPKLNFKYYDKNNNLHYYYPDFLVDDKIIEIKPAKCFDESGNYRSIWKKKAKNIENDVDFYKGECMKQNGIKIMTEYELEECFKYVIGKYGLDFIQKHKLKRKSLV